MRKNKELLFDYVPRDRPVYVDTSACSWFYNNSRINNSRDFSFKTFEVYSAFASEFSNREIVTVEGVLKEVLKRIENYRGHKKSLKAAKSRARKRDGGSQRNGFSAKINDVKRIISAQGRIYKMLQDGVERGKSIRNSVYSEYVRNYILSLNRGGRLSPVDLSLVVKCISDGSSRGLITADADMQSCYETAVFYYALENCFSSSPIVSSTKEIAFNRR